MGSFNEDWDTNWTSTSINASSVANAGSATTAAISNDNKLETEVGVSVAYGGTASEGIKVYILRDVDGSNYEDANTAWGFEMPKAVSTTYRRTISVGSASNFKVLVTNNTGASVTVTVTYRQAAGITA